MSKVFISYVREDSEFVDLLVEILKLNGLEVSLDRESIQPGQRWKTSISRAIRNGAYFISVHSKQRRSRQKSYVNEELTLAIEELRKFDTNSVWLIPIKIDDVEYDDRSIGGGETLSDLNWCDMTNWESGATSLLRSLGVPSPKISLGEPIAPGFPAEIGILSGFIKYSHMSGAPDLLQGMEVRITGGWCQRVNSEKILFYVETSAPLQMFDEINRMVGLSGYYGECSDRVLSSDPDNPSIVRNNQKFFLPPGSVVPNFNTGQSVHIPFGIELETNFSAKGYLVGKKFVGSFQSVVEISSGVAPQKMPQSGIFEFIFDI